MGEKIPPFSYRIFTFCMQISFNLLYWVSSSLEYEILLKTPTNCNLSLSERVLEVRTLSSPSLNVALLTALLTVLFRRED